MNTVRERFPSHHLYTAVIFLLPFCFFYWMMPFVAGTTLGNDYQLFSIQAQMELFFSLKTGSFPLYIPGYVGGQSASALTLGEVYHPLIHLASWLPGYWTGNALEWNSLLRLMSLAAAHFFLFRLLCSYRLKPAIALLLSLSAVYNLRMLDLFRYGASLESWTGFIFLYTAIAHHYHNPSGTRGTLSIVFATYWMICSGHVQMVYYCFIGIFLFIMAIPFLLDIVHPPSRNPGASHYPFWRSASLSCMAGIFLAAAYLLPFYYDFVAASTRHHDPSYEWAVLGKDSVAGILNNFIQPLRSDIHVAFGGTALFLAAMALPMVRIKRKIPAVVWCLWCFALLVLVLMLGEGTPVYQLFFKHLPFADAFRIPGRIAIILPMLLLLLLVWLFHENGADRPDSARRNANPLLYMAGAASLLFIAGLAAMQTVSPQPTRYAAAVIRRIDFSVEQWGLLAGGATLACLLFYAAAVRKRSLFSGLLLITTIGQLFFCIQFGTWIAPKIQPATFDQMVAEKRQRLTYRGVWGYRASTADYVEQATLSYIEPYLAQLYGQYLPAGSRMEAFQRMAKGRAPGQVVIQSPPPPLSTRPDSTKTGGDSGRIRLEYGTFNRLVFRVSSPEEQLLGLAYLYSSHWRAFVNGVKVPVYRANGNYMAVLTPAGDVKVEFRYWSTAAAAGMAISATTLFIICVLFCLHRFRKTAVRAVAISLAFGICALLTAWWFGSLYTGGNLNSAYHWQQPPSSHHQDNVAYSRRTSMSSLSYANYPGYRSSGAAVDNDRTSESGALTGNDEAPWWLCDLAEPVDIATLHLYEPPSTGLNNRPVQILVSTNKKRWRLAASLDSECPARPCKISFTPPETARYLMIRTAGPAPLAFDEVEIFPREGERATP